MFWNLNNNIDIQYHNKFDSVGLTQKFIYHWKDFIWYFMFHVPHSTLFQKYSFFVYYYWDLTIRTFFTDDWFASSANAKICSSCSKISPIDIVAKHVLWMLSLLKFLLSILFVLSEPMLSVVTVWDSDEVSSMSETVNEKIHKNPYWHTDSSNFNWDTCVEEEFGINEEHSTQQIQLLNL